MLADIRIPFERSEVGGKPANQDRYAIHQDLDNKAVFIVVADGVGGSSKGELAAEIITGLSATYWENHETYDSLEDLLSRFLEEANNKISELNEAEDLKSASTVAALFIRGDLAVSVHAGDCRVYQFSDDAMTKHTRDHSLAYAKFMMGELKEEEVADHATQNQLLNCLDGSEDMEPEITQWDLSEGTDFIISSDGFWEVFSQEQMLELINSDDRKFIFTNQFENYLEKNPKHDNTTVVVLGVGEKHADEAEEEPPMTEQTNTTVAQEKSSGNNMLYIAMAILLGILILAIYSLTQGSDEKNLTEPVSIEEKPAQLDAELSNTDVSKKLPTVEAKSLVGEAIEMPRGEAGSGEDQTDLINSGLGSLGSEEEVIIPYDPSAPVADQVEDGLKESGQIGPDDELEQTEERGMIVTLQLMHNGFPIFGGVVKVLKNTSAQELEVMKTSKFAKVENLPDSPVHSAEQCVQNYAAAQGITTWKIEQVIKTWVNADRPDYMYEVIASDSQAGGALQPFNLYLYDSDCSLFLKETRVIHSETEVGNG